MLAEGHVGLKTYFTHAIGQKYSDGKRINEPLPCVHKNLKENHSSMENTELALNKLHDNYINT